MDDLLPVGGGGLRVQDSDIGMVRQPELAFKRLALGLSIVEFAHQQLGINAILDGRNHAIDVTADFADFSLQRVSVASTLLAQALALDTIGFHGGGDSIGRQEMPLEGREHTLLNFAHSNRALVIARALVPVRRASHVVLGDDDVACTANAAFEQP